MVATGGHIIKMNVTIKKAKYRLSEFVRLADSGVAVVLTRHDQPVADLVPRVERKGGINWRALDRALADHPLAWREP